MTERISYTDGILTERLILRRFREADGDDLYEFLSQLENDEYEGYPGITMKTVAGADTAGRRSARSREPFSEQEHTEYTPNAIRATRRRGGFWKAPE